MVAVLRNPRFLEIHDDKPCHVSQTRLRQPSSSLPSEVSPFPAGGGRHWACGPTPGTGPRRQGGHGGVLTRSVEKTRVKNGFVFPIPPPQKYLAVSRSRL